MSEDDDRIDRFKQQLKELQGLAADPCSRKFVHRNLTVAESEDCVQKTYVDVRERLQKNFDAGRNIIIGLKLRKYWFGALRKRSCDPHRERSRREAKYQDFQRTLEPIIPRSPEEALDRKQFLQAFEQAVKDLSANQRDAIWFRKVEELPRKEVAEILGISPGEVSRRVSLAISSLRVSKRLSQWFEL